MNKRGRYGIATDKGVFVFDYKNSANNLREWKDGKRGKLETLIWVSMPEPPVVGKTYNIQILERGRPLKATVLEVEVMDA